MHAIYMSIDDSLRRIANQAFFNKLIVQDDDTINSDSGAPFNVSFKPGSPAPRRPPRRTEGGIWNSNR